MTLTAEDALGGLTVLTVTPGRFVGQVICDGERVVYASILASKRWLQDRRWKDARPFTI